MNNLTNEKYRYEIDGIRAFAVIAVILNHFNADILPSGFLGVDIFFVISGYVITCSLSRRKSDNFWDFIIGFYARRIKRLIPALFICVLISSLIVFAIIPEPQINIRTGISSLFGISNIYLYRNLDGYFTESAELNFFTHTWSLGVEEQFYFIFPLLIWFSGFYKNKLKNPGIFIKNITFLSIFSLGLYLIFNFLNKSSLTYFFMPFRFWEMALGSLTFMLISRDNIYLNLFKKLPTSILFALSISILFFDRSHIVINTILINLLTCLLIISLCRQSGIKKFLKNKFILYVGSLSYSLYLWHWSVLTLARWTIGVNKFTVIPLVLIILIISHLSYIYIENTFRYSLNKRNFTIILINLISLFSLSSLLYIIQRIDTHFYRFLFLGKTPEINQINTLNSRKLYFIGDSYARDLYTLTRPSRKLKIEKMIMDGCSFYELNAVTHPKCIRHKDNWNKIFNKAKSKDIVFAISSSFDENRNIFLRSILPDLLEKDVTLITNLPFPQWKVKVKNGYLCQKEWYRPYLDKKCYENNGFEMKSYKDKNVIDYSQELKTIADEFDNFKLIDYSKILCEERCLPFKDGKSFTYDGGHLYRWSPSLTTRFSKYINSIFF